MFQTVKTAASAIRSRANELAITGVVSASTLPVLAQAQTTTIDTTAVTGFITSDIIAGIVAVGTVFLLVAATFAGFRWVRGAAGGN
jgi:hypothetical protein